MKTPQMKRAPLPPALTVPAKAYRSWNQHHFYVSALPEYRNGKQHGDFGYSDDAASAITLTPYWQRRIRRQVLTCSQVDTVRFF